jgi:hypothetical protein
MRKCMTRAHGVALRMGVAYAGLQAFSPYVVWGHPDHESPDCQLVADSAARRSVCTGGCCAEFSTASRLLSAKNSALPPFRFRVANVHKLEGVRPAQLLHIDRRASVGSGSVHSDTCVYCSFRRNGAFAGTRQQLGDIIPFYVRSRSSPSLNFSDLFCEEHSGFDAGDVFRCRVFLLAP